MYIRWIGIKFDFVNNHFKLEFVDSGLYLRGRSRNQYSNKMWAVNIFLITEQWITKKSNHSGRFLLHERKSAFLVEFNAEK